MRIAVSKSAQHNTTSVRLAVPVGILKKQQVRVLANIDAAVAQLKTCWDVQASRKDGRLVCAAIAVGIFENDDLVVGKVARKDVGISRRGGHIHTPRRIPPDGEG